ncbi:MULTISPECIES: hypothetical protein [Xanthomonas]|uniref:hypothetical protein n=1 Tax=Xanthomonas TaxID=338 RepID=UPI001FD26C85|nr:MULTISPECIES: hypothetical protein [Xanthomonas]
MKGVGTGATSNVIAAAKPTTTQGECRGLLRRRAAILVKIHNNGIAKIAHSTSSNAIANTPCRLNMSTHQRGDLVSGGA